MYLRRGVAHAKADRPLRWLTRRLHVIGRRGHAASRLPSAPSPPNLLSPAVWAIDALPVGTRYHHEVLKDSLGGLVRRLGQSPSVGLLGSDSFSKASTIRQTIQPFSEISDECVHVTTIVCGQSGRVQLPGTTTVSHKLATRFEATSECPPPCRRGDCCPQQLKPRVQMAVGPLTHNRSRRRRRI